MNGSPTVAVIIPTRGQVYSATFEEVLRNIEGYKADIYWSHGRPIPDCFNVPLEVARGRGGYDWYIIWEEDMCLPEDTLDAMIQTAAKHQVRLVTNDYPVTKAGQSALTRDSKGEIIFGGTGSLLMRGDYVAEAKTPLFRSDIKWNMRMGKWLELTPEKADSNATYGMHDVTFGIMNYHRGERMVECDIKLGQRKLFSVGATGTNAGSHGIEEWTVVTPHSLFGDNTTVRADTGTGTELTMVTLSDGTQTQVPRLRARELVEQGRATMPSPKDVVIVENDVWETL